MKNRFAVFLSIFTLLGCGYPSKKKISGKSELVVSWQVISNFVGESDEFDARFFIKNKGKVALSDKNWALFFNMAPRPILPNKTPQPARVEHINGDWYKLVPESGFALASSDSIEVRYTGTEGVIKETDAPLGLYIVYYDDDGKQERIKQIGDATVLPFTTKEQMLRGKADQKPLPTAAQRYNDNLLLHPLTEDELLPIIPSPVRVLKNAGTYKLDGSQKISFGKGLENEADFLSKRLKAITKADYAVSGNGDNSAKIILKIGEVRVNGIDKETYRLDISADKIVIEQTKISARDFMRRPRIGNTSSYQ